MLLRVSNKSAWVSRPSPPCPFLTEVRPSVHFRGERQRFPAIEVSLLETEAGRGKLNSNSVSPAGQGGAGQMLKLLSRLIREDR